MEAYTFTPFEDASKQLRFLDLAPASDLTTPLSGSLSTTLVTDKVKFEALSYVWGSPLDSHSFVCNGAVMKIGQNLDTALRYCRHKRKSRRLWVDAICIDQENETEKAEQIKLMGHVFEKAEHALIWLGDVRSLSASVNGLSDTHSLPYCEEQTRRFFRRVQHRRHILLLTLWINLLRYTVRGVTHAFGLSNSKVYGNLGEGHGILSLILKVTIRIARVRQSVAWEMILGSSWFERVWTAQEMLLGASPIFMCGPHRAPASSFAAILASEHSDTPSDAFRSAGPRLAQWLMYRILRLVPTQYLNFLVDGPRAFWNRNDSRKPYEHMLRDFAASGVFMIFVVATVLESTSASATNPSDHVIGSLALFRHLLGVDLVSPDYSLDLAELYARATASLLRECHYLVLLLVSCSLSRKKNQYSTSDLPSWAIEWRGPASEPKVERAANTLTYMAVGGFSTKPQDTARPNATRHSVYRDLEVPDNSHLELHLESVKLVNEKRCSEVVVEVVPNFLDDSDEMKHAWASLFVRFATNFDVQKRNAVLGHLLEVVGEFQEGFGGVGLQTEHMMSDLTMLWDIALDSKANISPMNMSQDSTATIQTGHGTHFFDAWVESLAARDEFVDRLSKVQDTVNFAEDLDTVLFITSGDRIGLALTGKLTAHHLRPDDNPDFPTTQARRPVSIALVAGLDFPILIRQVDGQKYELIDVAIVSGTTQGELWPDDLSACEPLCLV